MSSIPPTDDNPEGFARANFALNDSNGNLRDQSQNIGSQTAAQDHENEPNLPDGSVEKNESSPPVDSEVHLCGYGRCTPKWLQRMHNASCLLMTISLCSIVQGIIVNGHLPASISTIERRFSLSSTQTGMIAGTYDFAVVLVLVPVCHFGGVGHKGRWLGFGMLLVGLGSFVLALPQFTTGPYEYAERRLGVVCSTSAPGTIPNTTKALCDSGVDTHTSNLSNYFYVFLFGQLLVGLGAAPLYTLGVAYLDESVTQKRSPVYLGLFTAFAVLGPAIGFIMGGQLLSIWGDWGKRAPSASLASGGSDDPRWYGAWWLGFLLCGMVAAVGGSLMLCFARSLPGSEPVDIWCRCQLACVGPLSETSSTYLYKNTGAAEHRAKDVDQANASAPTSPFSENLVDLPKACWALLQNGTFSALIVMQTVEAFMLNAMATFMPKVFENLYNMTPTTASMLCGAILVPCGFVGNILGGWLMGKFSLRCRGALILAIIFNIFCLIFMPAFLLSCPQAEFVGATVPYRGVEEPRGFVRSQCNAPCHCESLYDPVCVKSADYNNESLIGAYSFFSACSAGCVSHDNNNDVGFDGLCPLDCGVTFYMSILLFSLLIIATFGSAMPVQQAMLRSVPFDRRSLALGLSWVFMRILGSIPGAILFGKIIDVTCSLALRDHCDNWLSCYRYDTKFLAIAVVLMGCICTIFIIISLIAALLLYTPPSENQEKSENVPSIPNRSIRATRAQSVGRNLLTNVLKRSLSRAGVAPAPVTPATAPGAINLHSEDRRATSAL